MQPRRLMNTSEVEVWEIKIEQIGQIKLGESPVA